VLDFAQREGKTKGRTYLGVLVAGEGPREDLGTWRRAVATVAQPSPRERRERTLGLWKKERQGCSRQVTGTPRSRPEASADFITKAP